TAAALGTATLLALSGCRCSWAQTGKPLADETPITIECFIERFVRFLVPPGEDRVVSGIERVPVTQIAAQRVDCVDSTKRHSLLYLDCIRTLTAAYSGFDSTARVINLLLQIIQRGRGFGRIYRRHASS